LTYTAPKIGTGANVKNVYEVLKEKQQDIERIRREIEALNAVLPMLEQEDLAQVVRSQRH
jgi:hypothetical protein